MKVTWEARKICGLPDDFPVSCTCVRIPTLRAHAETIVIETEEPVDIEAARKAFAEAPGIKLVDDVDKLEYPHAPHGDGTVRCGGGTLAQIVGVWGSRDGIFRGG